jgi:hypothetical protein
LLCLISLRVSVNHSRGPSLRSGSNSAIMRSKSPTFGT